MQSPRVSGNNVLLSAVACVLLALVGGACCCCYLLGKEHKPKHGIKIDVEYGKFEKPSQTP